MFKRDFFEELASIVLFHRKKAKINRASLSILSGVSKTVIYDIEHGKKTIRLENIVKILDALNIKLELNSPLMKEYYETRENIL